MDLLKDIKQKRNKRRQKQPIRRDVFNQISAVVKKYGLRLVPKRFKKFNPIENRKQAEQIEQWLTYKLRKKGHGVWSN